MIKKRAPLLGLILILYSFAQATSLGFGTVTLSRDTLGFDDTLFATAQVINYDTAAYYAPLNFGYRINGVQNVSTSIFDASVQGDLVSIPAGDSILVSIVVVVAPDYFEIGPDILVVWPIAFTGEHPFNFTEQQIYVIDPTGIQQIDTSDNQVQAVYFNQNIYLHIKDANIILNQVRVFDLAGNLILLRSDYNGMTNIPFGEESAGIYFIELRYNNQQRKVIKLAKF